MSADLGLKAMEALTLALKAYLLSEDVKSTNDMLQTAKTITKSGGKKLKWDEIKLFKNKEMDAISKNLREVVKALQAVNKATFRCPPDESEKYFRAAVAKAKKEGIDGKGTAKEIKKILAHYESIVEQAGLMIMTVTQQEKRVTPMLANAELTSKAMAVLEKEFLNCAKIPNPISSGQQAMFVALSQDAKQAKGEANQVVKLANTYLSRAASFRKDLQKCQNAALDWADIAGFDGIKIEVQDRL